MEEITFVGTGETQGYPSLMCKKDRDQTAFKDALLHSKNL